MRMGPCFSTTKRRPTGSPGTTSMPTASTLSRVTSSSLILLATAAGGAGGGAGGGRFFLSQTTAKAEAESNVAPRKRTLAPAMVERRACIMTASYAETRPGRQTAAGRPTSDEGETGRQAGQDRPWGKAYNAWHRGQGRGSWP